MAAYGIGKNTVFNLGGINNRLILTNNDKRGEAFPRHVLTHADYSRGAWKKT
ncbi:MAG: type II toxin-antitoxin system HigB family toxin [Isosphaerales bacterium]